MTLAAPRGCRRERERHLSRAHVDDLIHFADGALLASVVGALAMPRVRTSWEAAGIATAPGPRPPALWEIGEWIGLKLGARGMNLTDDDTVTDLIETPPARSSAAWSPSLRHPSRLRRVPGRPTDPVVALHADDPDPPGPGPDPASVGQRPLDIRTSGIDRPAPDRPACAS